MRLPHNLAALIISGFVLVNAAKAQTAKGVVYKKISSERLAQVLVTNLHTKAVVLSDQLGNFAIKAIVGDTLLFNQYQFTPQKQEVSIYDMVVYLQPTRQLGEVVVKGQTRKQEMNNIIKDYRSKGLYFDGNPPAKVFSPFGGSPLTGLYELFSKDAKNERRFMKYSKAEVEATEVDRRYNKPFVMRIVGLNDSTAKKFMEFYRPSFEDLKEWNDYELIKHIKSNFEFYKKEGAGMKLPKLY